MDYQEAIKEAEIQIDMYESMILYNRDFEPKNDNSNYERKIDFLKTIISAMKELQLYKYSKLCLIPENVYGKQCDELDEYKQLGTLEEVREAVEKQKAKKPNYEGDGYAPDGTFVYDEWECPNCGKKFEVDYDDYDYCPKCGQAIDWSEEE